MMYVDSRILKLKGGEGFMALSAKDLARIGLKEA